MGTETSSPASFTEGQVRPSPGARRPILSRGQRIELIHQLLLLACLSPPRPVAVGDHERQTRPHRIVANGNSTATASSPTMTTEPYITLYLDVRSC